MFDENEDNTNLCPDCGCEVGEPHYAGCDVERCPACGHQRLSCSCSEAMVWSGVWPGVEDCRRLNLWCKVDGQGFVECSKDTPGASEDLNSLCYPICQWDVKELEWVPGPGYADRVKNF